MIDVGVMRWFPLAVIVVAGAACADPSQRCGVKTSQGACVSTLSVSPNYRGVATSDVDVVQDQCLVTPGVPAPGDGGVAIPPRYEAEYFADHNVVVRISNRPPVELGAYPDRAPPVVLSRTRVEYHLNGICESSCPDLDPLEFDGPTATVLSGTETDVTLPFMPLRRKIEFVDRGGATNGYPSYTAHYTVLGTDPKGEFEISFDAEFTAGDFDFCKKPGE